MNKKIKKTLVILLLILVLTSSALIPKIKLDFHRKHVKQHKHRIAKIKAIDTLQMNKDTMRLKLFTRQQWLKKRKLEARKAEEKRERIKEEHIIKLNKEREIQKKKKQEKPYYIVNAILTAYTYSGGVGDGLTMANGKRPQAGISIAAPKNIPLGSVVDIPGLGRRIVSDRGSKIVGNTFDVFFETEQECINFGRQFKQIKIYKN
jgi:3D (Asp-Asp-Asp) domain-containing protein